MNQSTITINVGLDIDKVPEQITWSATQSTAEEAQKAKAMMLSFWDGQEKAALRIDLWTKDMKFMVCCAAARRPTWSTPG